MFIEAFHETFCCCDKELELNLKKGDVFRVYGYSQFMSLLGATAETDIMAGSITAAGQLTSWLGRR